MLLELSMGAGWHERGAPNSAREVLEGLLEQIPVRVLRDVSSG